MMRLERLQNTAFNALCVLCDFFAVEGAALFFWSLQNETLPLWRNLDPNTQRLLAFLTPTAIFSIALAGAYRDSLRTTFGRQMVYLAKGIVLCAAITVPWLAFTEGGLTVGSPFSFGGFVLLSLVITRYVVDILREALLGRGWGKSPALILGINRDSQALADRIATSPWLPYSLKGFIAGAEAPAVLREAPVFRPDAEGWSSLLPHLKRAILVIPMAESEADREYENLISLCREHAIQVRKVVAPSDLKRGQAHLSDLLGMPVVVRERKLRKVNETLKRYFDILGSAIGLVILAPLFGLIAIAIKIDSAGPVFYRQSRLTKNSRRFSILKFRSMVRDADRQRTNLQTLNEADGPLFKIRKDPRITRVGALLRKSSLDELPQLYNVLRGDLSLVGPRPPTPAEVADYLPWQKKRLDVVQGMTGLWQVSGRSELTFEEMVLLDLYYIEHWSLRFDVEILIETVPSIVLRRGAY